MTFLSWYGQRSLEANIPRFYAYRFLWQFYLFLPIWVIFLQQKRGLSLIHVTLLDAVFWLTVGLGEVPTGAIADTFGRKRSLIIGVLLSAASISLFGLAPTYPLLMLANVLWAVSVTFDSGAAQALLYESLRALGREADYTRLRGRQAVVEQVSFAISSALGGLLGALDLLLPFVAYAALILASLSQVLPFKEPPREPDPASGKPLGYVQTLTLTAQTIKQAGGLRYALLYAAVLPLATFIAGIVLLQPYALGLGVPIAALGLLIFGLRSVGMIGSAASHRLVARFGEEMWLRMAPVLVVGGMLGLGLSGSVWGIASFALVGFSSAATRPVIETIIVRQVPGHVRATILSVGSVIFCVLVAIAEPATGWIGDRYGLPLGFLALGSGIGIGMLIVLLLWSREPCERQTAAAS